MQRMHVTITELQKERVNMGKQLCLFRNILYQAVCARLYET